MQLTCKGNADSAAALQTVLSATGLKEHLASLALAVCTPCLVYAWYDLHIYIIMCALKAGARGSLPNEQVLESVCLAEPGHCHPQMRRGLFRDRPDIPAQQGRSVQPPCVWQVLMPYS